MAKTLRKLGLFAMLVTITLATAGMKPKDGPYLEYVGPDLGYCGNPFSWGCYSITVTP